jgi:hydroxypyruvate reductase
MIDPRSQHRRDIAIAIHAAAVAGVDPRAATRHAVASHIDNTSPAWIIALGKASLGMTEAAVAELTGRGVQIDGGIVVAPEIGTSPHPKISVVAGDHPVPNHASREAAAAIESVAKKAAGNGTVFVLLSGGATSLVAAPINGVADRDLTRLFDGLLSSGADITVMNAIRKRFTRWGAGRLARALAPSHVHCLIVSDVVGDDVASIGSGPCVPDRNSAADVLAMIERDGLEPYVPRALRDLLEDPASPEPPPAPDDPFFRHVHTAVILANRDALDAAAAHAKSVGADPVRVMREPLVDDATFTAQRLVDELVRFREADLPDGDGIACMIWGGETTVRLGAGEPVPGGRCQELALAAADALHVEAERGEGITLLAGGTDGRDGSTDAAGAVVDAMTWDAIRSAGRDPADDLAEHRAYYALGAVDALVRTGLSGTNVGDVVIGVVERRTRQASLNG